MENSLVTKSEYLPAREVLSLQLDMSQYLLDYYVHMGQHVGSMEKEHDDNLKTLIVCFAFHLTVRPPGETHAWTLHLHAETPYSLFVTGSAENNFIVGHVLSENIRHTDVNTLHAQISRSQGEASKSSVQCESSKITDIVEHYYLQSEQLPIRISLSQNTDTAVAIAAMPEYDTEWFAALDINTLAELKNEKRKDIKSCMFQFSCDCSPDKLLPFLRSISDEELEELYGNDEELTVNCPRCGRYFLISRNTLTPTLN